MTRSKTNEFEKAVILLLNTFDNWNLEHTGSTNKVYDAIGMTPKGRKCVIEMKFRTKYYETKMLEVHKYDNLMKLDKDVIKIYFVSDPEGTYFYWLDGIKKFDEVDKYCPTTSYWGAGKQKKKVYLLPENLASYIYKK
jgi:hypothetical protein